MINKITFTWEIQWDCNYSCPYCWYHGKWKELKQRNVYPSFEKLSSIWKRIYDLYGECQIEIVGGEPSIYPQFSKLILELLKYHTVSVTTNLSGNIDILINNIDEKIKNRLKIGATFHPLFADINEFLPKIKKVNQKGIYAAAVYLAYPPQLQDIPKYKKIFTDNDIVFSVLTFWGVYNGKKYPDSYTDNEKEIIGISLSSRNNEKFQTEPLITKGKLCNAGHKYALIHPDGEVIPCGGASREGKEIIIGNIFDKNFKLYDKAMQCPSQNCPCNEWSNLMVR